MLNYIYMSANSDKSPKDTNNEKLKNYIKTI